jgi:protein-S-isoprenylcysteine O-methyltransferase Ste14
MSAIEITSRVRFEEALMLEYFGEQYREYMKRTGQLFPSCARRRAQRTAASAKPKTK